MHYQDPEGHSVELEPVHGGMLLLSPAECRLLTPSEALDYVPADERRRARRRHTDRTGNGRRRRDYVELEADVQHAVLREKVRISGEMRLALAQEVTVDQESVE